MRSGIPVALFTFSLLTAGTVFFHHSIERSVVSASVSAAPAYDKAGDLLFPSNYREWTYLTAGIDMSYTATASPTHSTFDNVFVNPEAYQVFVRTGTWPDKTMIVLEVREAKDRGSINLRGHFQSTEVRGIEVHLKDEARFPDKWAFFNVGASNESGKLIPRTADCYSCHSAHGAVDTTFVQFYPTLLPVARQKATLSAAYLKESAADPVTK